MNWLCLNSFQISVETRSTISISASVPLLSILSISVSASQASGKEQPDIPAPPRSPNHYPESDHATRYKGERRLYVAVILATCFGLLSEATADEPLLPVGATSLLLAHTGGGDGQIGSTPALAAPAKGKTWGWLRFRYGVV